MIVVCVRTQEPPQQVRTSPKLFSTVLVERHGGGALSEGLQPKVLSFEQIPFETGVSDHGSFSALRVGQLGICPPLNMTVLKLGSAHHHGQTPNDL